MTNPPTRLALALALALMTSASACSTPTPSPDAPSTPADVAPEPAAEVDPDPEPTEPELNSGHDMRQRSNEEIDEVPMDRRPEGVDCDRCAHVKIGTQGGTKHRCLEANPELATNPDADSRVSCDDRCCPDME